MFDLILSIVVSLLGLFGYKEIKKIKVELKGIIVNQSGDNNINEVKGNITINKGNSDEVIKKINELDIMKYKQEGINKLFLQGIRILLNRTTKSSKTMKIKLKSDK